VQASVKVVPKKQIIIIRPDCTRIMRRCSSFFIASLERWKTQYQVAQLSVALPVWELQHLDLCTFGITSSGPKVVI